MLFELIEQTDNTVLYGQLNGTTTSEITSDGAATFAGQVKGLFFQSTRDAGTSTCFEGFLDTASDPAVQTSIIRADGSALFKGNVFCDVSGVSGASLNTTYGLTSYNVSSSNSTYLARFTSGGGAGEVAAIKADGSAMFQGKLTVNDQAEIYRNTSAPGNTLLAFKSDFDGTKQLVAEVTANGTITANGYSFANLQEL